MKALLFFMLAAMFCAHSVYPQKSYNFDYVLEYEYEHPTNDGKTHTHTHYRFINSSDNSYVLLINVEEKIVSMRLLTEAGKFYYSTISEEDFLVEAISLKCPATGQMSETKLNNYTVENKGDTLVDNRKFSRFKLLPANEKKFRKGELTARHVTMDNTLNLRFPFFTPDDTAYRFYKEGKKIPNGFLKESVLTDFEGNVVGRSRLIQYFQLKKIIMVDKNCK